MLSIKRSFLRHFQPWTIQGLFLCLLCVNTHFKIYVLKTMSHKIGYARVSTDDQDLSLQIDALEKAGCDLIYKDKASGKNRQREEFEHCLKALRTGDTLVVWRLDRLGRSLSDLVKIITELENNEIAFESLTEKIETRSATGKLMFHVFAALAEFERNVIRERTQAGLKAARARGKKRSEEHTSELQSRGHLVCRLLLEKKKTQQQDK